MWLKVLLTIALFIVLAISIKFVLYPGASTSPSSEAGVSATPTQWVDAVFLDPVAISLTQDDDLHIVLGRLQAPIEELEFKVHQRVGTNWQVLQDWVAWPVPAFKSITTGASSLQVDIRRRGAEFVQKIWMGDYFFHDQFELYPSLYRTISSTMFDIDDRDALNRKLGDRLNLIFPLLTSTPIQSCLQACEVEQLEGGIVQSKSSAGLVTRSADRLTWAGAPLSLNLSQFRQFDQIQAAVTEIVPNLDDRLLQIIFVVQSIYRGFWSGSPAQGFTKSHFQALSMCNTYSYSLIRLLAHLGVEADFVTYENEFGGAHAFVRITSPTQTLLLDAMEGRVLFSDLPPVIAGVAVPTLSLPRFQETGRDIAIEIPKGRGLWISKKVDFDRGQAIHSAPSYVDLKALRGEK